MPKSKTPKLKPLPYKFSTTTDQLSSRSGLIAPVRLLKALHLARLADQYFPAPGSNRGYRASDIIMTFILMLHEGATCLEDVKHLRKEKGLLKLLGIKAFPDADTLGRWLRRYGRAGVPLVEELSRVVMDATLSL